VFKNVVLRMIFRPERVKETADCRKMQNEELHDLYSAPDFIIVIKQRGIRWVRYVAHTGEKGNAYRVAVGKTEYMRLLGRPRHRLEDSIKIDLTEMGWGGMDWIQAGCWLVLFQVADWHLGNLTCVLMSNCE
jgi:hypothetical protein